MSKTMKKKWKGIRISLKNTYLKFLNLKLLHLIYVITITININASVFSQGTKFHVHAKDKTLREIFRLIEDDSGFRFFYSDNFRDLDRRLTVNLQENKIDEVLDKLLENSSITFELMDNNIVVITPNKQLQKNIKGKVTDALSREPLPGVNVFIKGTTTGTITDVDGNYNITIPDEQAVLVFSFVGYHNEEIQVENKEVIDILLSPSIESLEEVVVVGYGSQKKVNLTGSVSSITSQEITQRPVPNSINLIQGKMSGVQIIQGTGQPGKENTKVSIRGMGSYGASSSPLILIDGIVGDLSYINPQDIESITVLKDAASAAIYGARAANGVILVTTKKGKVESLKFSYSNNFAIHEATRLPELIYNSVETMEMWNKAAIHSSNAIRFTDEEIEAYRQGQYTNPLQYPNYNWIENTFKKGFVQTHHFGLNGGSENVIYNTSFSMVDQDGILPGHSFKRYTANLNLTVKLNERIELSTGLLLSQREIREPSFSNDSFVLMVFGQTGLQMPYLPDGSGRYTARAYPKLWQNRNPVAVANEWKKTYNHFDIRPQVNLKVDILDGLTWNTKGAINYEPSYEKLHVYPLDSYYYQKINADDEDYRWANNQWPKYQGVTKDNYYSMLTTLFSTLEYNKTMGMHSFKLLGGYSQEYQYYEELGAYRSEYPTNTLSEIDVGSTEIQSNNGTANEWALQSFFGRLNYSFNDKYLAEANLRYDGTSRISKQNRWGIFPSFSAGWRISNENFLKNAYWMDNLKMRVSYGQLGNQEIGLYPYQRVLDLTYYSFGSTTEQGVYVTDLTDQSLKWETTNIFDIGLDFSMKRGLFSLVIDWYNKITDDILYKQKIPESVGLNAPTVNYGSMQNKGLDFEIGHRYQIGDFKWEITGLFSTYRNKVLKLLSTSYSDNDTRINQEGLPWGSYYLYEWIGVFQSEEEIENSPVQPYSPQPGDLKFKDQNGDNIIDGDDRKVFDGAHSKYSYSLRSRVEWKNFDLSVFFQGDKGRKLYVINWGISPFTQGGAPPVKWRNAWSEDNPTNEMPALYVEGYAPNTSLRNTFNLQDATYFRIKNINIGYTIPKPVCERLKLDYIRVYFSGDNLLTITDYEGLDPERSGNTNFAQYPQVRILSVGMNVNF